MPQAELLIFLMTMMTMKDKCLYISKLRPGIIDFAPVFPIVGLFAAFFDIAYYQLFDCLIITSNNQYITFWLPVISIFLILLALSIRRFYFYNNQLVVVFYIRKYLFLKSQIVIPYSDIKKIAYLTHPGRGMPFRIRLPMKKYFPNRVFFHFEFHDTSKAYCLLYELEKRAVIVHDTSGKYLKQKADYANSKIEIQNIYINRDSVTICWRFPKQIQTIRGFNLWLDNELIVNDKVLTKKIRKWTIGSLSKGVHEIFVETAAFSYCFNKTSKKYKIRIE